MHDDEPRVPVPAVAAPLKVLHVAEAFGGGIFEVLRLLTGRSAQSGHLHTVLYARRPETPEHPRSMISPHVRLVEVDWRRRSPPSQVSAGRRMRALCQSLEPDVVHLHSSFAGAVGAAALRGRVPLVYTPHAFASSVAGSPGRRLMLRQLERQIVRRVDAVGAVSRSEAEMACALGARVVVCVPNGIPELDDIDWPDPAARAPSEPPRIVGAGRLIPQRSPVACARIMAALRDEADVGWLGGAGYGPLAAEASAALAGAGAPPTGWLPREDVLAELRRATAYLHWTTWDGLALSLLEAIACDTVVIASDVPPNREVLDPRALCGTEAEAVARLRQVIADPGFAAELRLAQRARATEHSAEAMVVRWTEVYEDLAPARGRGSQRRAVAGHVSPSV